MKGSVRDFVRGRAEQRCEYCRLHESDQPLLSFHVEHIVAKKHHGSDNPDNLAWACLECNAAKSSNLIPQDAGVEHPCVGCVVQSAFRPIRLNALPLDLDSFRQVGVFNDRRRRKLRYDHWHSPGFASIIDSIPWLPAKMTEKAGTQREAPVLEPSREKVATLLSKTPTMTMCRRDRVMPPVLEGKAREQRKGLTNGEEASPDVDDSAFKTQETSPP
jgi:hypothetical protein